MNRMRELVDRLNETAYQYYTLDAPTISDKEWDALYDELVRLEKETGERLPDSPTRRVGGAVLRVTGEGLTLKSMTEREVRIGGRIDGVEFLR